MRQLPPAAPLIAEAGDDTFAEVAEAASVPIRTWIEQAIGC